METFAPKNLRAWRSWLQKHHAGAPGVWLVNYKKDSGGPHIPYNDLVEEALAFGWIDSKPRSLDAERSMLYFAPRKAGSGWSKLNKERVERLTAAGRIAPAGLAKVEAAKADGSWKALDGVEALAIPPDLAAAFHAHPGSATHFEAFPRFTKRAILEWIGNAHRSETRSNRVDETARLAAKNVRANQWKRTAGSSILKRKAGKT